MQINIKKVFIIIAVEFSMRVVLKAHWYIIKKNCTEKKCQTPKHGLWNRKSQIANRKKKNGCRKSQIMTESSRKSKKWVSKIANND